MLKRKRLIFGKATSALTTIAFWAVLVGIAVININEWAAIFSLIVAYILADTVLDYMMAKWNDKSTHRTFALYLPAILIGSAIGELMGQVALVGSAEMALIIPHLSQTQYWFAIGVIGTTAAMSMLWGRVLDIVQADANKQKRSRQRWRRLLR